MTFTDYAIECWKYNGNPLEFHKKIHFLKGLFPARLNRHKLTEKDFLPEEIFSSVIIEDSFKYEMKYAIRNEKTYILEEKRTPSSECEGEYIVFPATVIKRRNAILKNLRGLTYK